MLDICSVVREIYRTSTKVIAQFSYQRHMSSFIALPTFAAVGVFNFGHSHGCLVVSHRGFNFYFPED